MQAIDVLGFSHIGFVVDSIDKFRATWEPILGLDGWIIREVGQDSGRVQLHGELVDKPTSTRVAFAKFQGTAIELIEPIEGPSGSSEWLRERGPGMQHIAVWVADLPTALKRVDGEADITYSPAVLRPALAGRPVSATVSADQPPTRPAFWAYIEPKADDTSWTLELLDAKFAADYHAYYGDRPFYPGELPGTSAG